ncbi:MAG: alpha/beta hydrolase [Ignavibacteriales bacterium]|nr:alpha/beta hydrolase [Ignavibacteriales bacterium]
MKNIILALVLATLSVIRINAEEVSIIVNGYILKGTLEIPKSKVPVDIALIIAGSGPTDRDGNNYLYGKGNPYKMLTELFLKEGIASLRYDKRGIGANNMVDESNLTFDMYINDAVEWIKYIRNDKRFSRIIVVGHSEGSLIGMVASRLTDVTKFISLCGPGKPIYKTLEEQIIIRDKMPEDLAKQFRSIIDSLKQGYRVKNVKSDFNSYFRPSVQSYMISWFKYDPCIEISKLKIPILIIGGTTDIQIQVEDAELLSRANENSKLAIIEDMNHLLKEVPTRDTEINFQSYGNPELPLSEELCKNLINFIKE